MVVSAEMTVAHSMKVTVRRKKQPDHMAVN